MAKAIPPLLLVLLFFAGDVLAVEKIRISVSGSYNMIFLTAGVAQKKGFFKDQDLDAEIIVMRPPTSIAALSSGDIDYTMLTGSVIRAAIRGLPVRLVAGFMSSSPHVLLARSEIKSVKELKGKKVGIDSYGAATHVLARIIIGRYGLDPDKEIQFLSLGSDSARFAALQQGLTDVVVTSPPWDFEGKKMGYNVLARAYDFVNFPLSGLGVSIKKVQENPGQVKRVVKALLRASRFISENREESARVLMEWGKVEAQHAYASYDSTVKVVSKDGNIPMDGLKLLIDLARKDAKITREISIGEVADFSILYEVQRELGLRSP